jgi:DNA-binding NtrC family response regulator
VLLADGGLIDRVDLGPATPATRAAAPAAAKEERAPAAAESPLAGELTALERQRIIDALAQCNGNQTRAAALLGMPRRTFVNRLETYGIPRPRRG